MEERERKHLHSSFIWATNTCSNNLHAVQTNIERPSEPLERVTWLLHRSCLRYLYPSCSAGLNKSHQAGSDSSYVDSVPNVVWRLGEHEIRPSRASLRDVVPSLDEHLARSSACLHAHETETLFDTICVADIFPQLWQVGAIGSGPLPRNPICLFVLFSALPCDPLHHRSHCHGSAAQKNPQHSPKTVTHKHTPWATKRR